MKVTDATKHEVSNIVNLYLLNMVAHGTLANFGSSNTTDPVHRTTMVFNQTKQLVTSAKK